MHENSNSSAPKIKLHNIEISKFEGQVTANSEISSYTAELSCSLNLLFARYNNQHLIGAAHVMSLLSLPVNIKESATDLKSINNSVSEQHESF
jgi:hypothetical protein